MQVKAAAHHARVWRISIIQLSLYLQPQSSTVVQSSTTKLSDPYPPSKSSTTIATRPSIPKHTSHHGILDAFRTPPIREPIIFLLRSKHNTTRLSIRNQTARILPVSNLSYQKKKAKSLTILSQIHRQRWLNPRHNRFNLRHPRRRHKKHIRLQHQHPL